MSQSKKYIIEVATNKASLEKLRSDLEKATQLPKEGVEVPALSREAKAQVKKDLATMFGVAEHQADALRKMMQAAADGFADGKSVEEMKNQLKETLEFTNSIMQKMQKMGDATSWMDRGVTFVDDFIKMKDSIGIIDGIEKSVGRLEKTFEKFKDALAETNADAFLQRFGTSTKNDAQEFATAQKELQKLAKTRNKVLKDILQAPQSDSGEDYSKKSKEEIDKIYQKQIETIRDYNEEIKDLRTKYKGNSKGLYSDEMYHEAIREISKAMRTLDNLHGSGDGIGGELRASMQIATDSIRETGNEIQNLVKKLQGQGIELAITLPDASSAEFASKINAFVKKANEQFQSKPITVSLDVTNPFKDIDVKEFSKKQKEMANRTKNTAQNALKGISGTDGDNGDLSILDDPEVGKILRRLYDSFEKIKKGVVSGQKSITDATKEWRREIDEELKLKFTWETSSNADQIQQMFDVIQDIAEDNPIHLFADTVSFIDDIQDALKDIKISINADIDNATIKSFSAPSDDIKKEFKTFKPEPIKPVLEENQDSDELSENSRALNTSTKSNNSLVEALNKLNTSINDTEQKKARAQTRKAEIESVAEKNAPTIKNKEKLIEENDKKITPLKQTQSKMKKEVDAIRKEIADIEKQRDNKADIKKLSIERDELRSNNRDGQFNDKIRELTAQIEQISEPYNAKIEEITSMKLTPAIKALEDVNAKISKLNDANTALVNEVDRLKQTSELENQDKVIKSTTKNLPQLTRRRDAVQSVIDNDKDIMALILEPLDSFYQKIEKTKEKADGINKNLEAKKKDLSDAETELQKLDADANKDAAKALKEKIVKLKSDVTELTTELEATTKTLDTSNVRKQLLEQKGFKDVRGLTEDDRTTFVTNLLKQSATLADELQNTSLRVDGNDIKLSIKSLQDLIYFIPEVQNTLGVVAKSSDQWANEKSLQERFINIFKLANQLKALGNISVKNDVAPTTEAIQEFIGVFEHVPVMAKVIEAAKEYLEKALALSNNTDAEKIAALTSEKDAALNTLMEAINGKRKDETVDGKQVSTYVPGAKSMIKDMMNGQEPLHVKVVGGSGTEKTYGLKRNSRDANLDVTGRNYTFANAGRAAKRFGIESLLAERFDIEATFGTLDAMRAERAAIAKELNDISKQEGNVTEAEKAALQTKKQELTSRLDFIKMADTRIGEIDDEIAKKVEVSTKKNAPIRTSRKSYETYTSPLETLKQEKAEKLALLKSLEDEDSVRTTWTAKYQKQLESGEINQVQYDDLVHGISGAIQKSKEITTARIDEINKLLELGNAQDEAVQKIHVLNNNIAISTAKVDEAKRAVKEYDKELKNGFTANDNGKAWAYDKIQREHKNAVIGRFGRTYSNDYTKTADMNQERWADFRHRLTTAKDNKTMNVDVISDIENMLNLRDAAIQELDSMTESQKKTSEGTKRVAELKKILLENSRDAILKKYYDTEGWYLNDLLSQRLKNIDLEFEQAKKSIQSGNTSSQSTYAKQIEEENRRYAQELKVLEQQRASTVSAYNIDEQSVVSAYLRNNEEVFSSAFVPILGKLLSQRDQETTGLSESSNEYKAIQQKYSHLIDEERAKLKASFLTPIEEYQQLINNLPNPDDLVKQRKAEIEKELSSSFASEVQRRGLKLGTDEYKALEDEYSTKLSAKYMETETSYRSSVSNEVQRKKEEIEAKLRNFIVKLVENHKKQLIDSFNADRAADKKASSINEIQAILSEAIDVAIKNAAKVHADNLAKILPEDVKTDEQIKEDINKKATERDAKKAQVVSEVMTGGKYISDMDLMRQETEKQRDAAQRVYEAEKQVLAQKQEQVENLRQEYNITDEMLQHSEAVAQAQQKQAQTRKQTANELKEYTSGGSVPSGGYYAGGIIDTSNLATESTLRGIYQLLNGGPPKGGWGDDEKLVSGVKQELDLSVKSFSSVLSNLAGSVGRVVKDISTLPYENMAFFNDEKRVGKYIKGDQNVIDANRIKGFLGRHTKENLKLALHNHPDGISALSPADIESAIVLADNYGIGASGSITPEKITGVDFSEVSKEIGLKILNAYKENIKKSSIAEIFDDNFEIKEEFANSVNLDKQKLSNELNKFLRNAIASVGLNSDDVFGQVDVASLSPEVQQAITQVADAVIDTGTQAAIESTKSITANDIKSQQTSFQEKFKTKNTETGKIEYSVKGASKIDQALYNVSDRLTKEALTDGDLAKLTKAYSQLENAFKEEIISQLDQETIDFLNTLRGQISSVLESNSSRLSAKDQQSKAITEAKDYLSKLKTEDGKRVSGASRASTGIDQVYSVLNKGKEELSDKDLKSIAEGYYRLQQTVNHAVFEKLDENTKKVINDAIQEAKTVLDKYNVTVKSDELVGTVLDESNKDLFKNANQKDKKKKIGRIISAVAEPQIMKGDKVLSSASVYLDGTSKKQAEERAAAEATITQEKKKQNQLASESAQVETKATEQAKERAKTEKKVTESKKKTQAVDTSKTDSGAGNVPPSTPSSDIHVPEGGGSDGGILGLLGRIAQESTLQSILSQLSSGVKTTSDKKGGSDKQGDKKKSDKLQNVTADDAWTTAQDYIKKNYPNFTSLGSLKSVSGGYSLDVFQPKNLEAYLAAQERINTLITEGMQDEDAYNKAIAERNILALEQEKITLRIANLNDKVQVTQEKSSFQNLALGVKAASKELQTVEGVLIQLHEVGALSIGDDGSPVSAIQGVTKYLEVLKALQGYQSKLSPGQLFDPTVNQNLSNLTLDLQNARKEIMSLIKASAQLNIGEKIETDKLKDGIEGLSDGDIKKVMQDIIADGKRLETSFKELTPITNEFGETIGYKLAYTLRTGKHEAQEMTAVLNPLTNELRVQKGAVKEVATGWQQFFNGLKGKAASIMQYLISITSIHDVFRYVGQGIQYVREIDGALTELKKVTDETDASYARFLQDMSKTGSVIGSTVKDLTSSAAD